MKPQIYKCLSVEEEQLQREGERTEDDVADLHETPASQEREV